MSGGSSEVDAFVVDRLVIDENCVMAEIQKLLLESIRMKIAGEIEERRVTIDSDKINFHVIALSDGNEHHPTLGGAQRANVTVHWSRGLHACMCQSRAGRNVQNPAMS